MEMKDRHDRNRHADRDQSDVATSQGLLAAPGAARGEERTLF